MINLCWLIMAILVLVVVIIIFSIKWLHRIWQLATFISLLTPEIIESVPFYKLVDILFGNSHALERHSPLTKISEHIKRAENGITPEGIQLDPIHSGRWNSYYPMCQAIETARTLWGEQNQKTKKCYKFKFDKTIGFVIKRYTKEKVETQMAFVVITKVGLVITAYPVIERADDLKDIIFLKFSTSDFLSQKNNKRE